METFYKRIALPLGPHIPGAPPKAFDIFRGGSIRRVTDEHRDDVYVTAPNGATWEVPWNGIAWATPLGQADRPNLASTRGASPPDAELEPPNLDEIAEVSPREPDRAANAAPRKPSTKKLRSKPKPKPVDAPKYTDEDDDS